MRREAFPIMKALLLLAIPLVVAARLGAQPLVVAWSTVAGGGGGSSDGVLAITGSAGQPAAGNSSDGTLTVQGGFWPAFTESASLNLNGFKVYFSVQSTATDQNYIGVVNSDGSGLARVVDTACWPRVSRDGKKMLYHPINWSTANFALNDLGLIDLATSNVVTLFHNTDYVVSYDWANDNTNAYFDFTCSILSINTETHVGNTVQNSDCYDDAPSVNPQDDSVAFHNSGGLMLCGGDGSNRRRLTNTSAGDYWPAWSPDGQWITFVNDSGYWKIKPDGSGRTNLWSHLPGAAHVKLNNQNSEGLAAFSPDGQWVVAPFILNNTNGIYALAADGSGLVRTIYVPANTGDQILNWIGTVLPVNLTPLVPPTLAIVPAGPGHAVISWAPATPGFVLQESDDLAPGNWTASASGGLNPVMVTTGGATKFYRLAHP